MPMVRIKGKLVTWLESKDKCWEVISHGCNVDGYPVMAAEGKTHRLHRLFYEHYVNPIPEGKCVRHTCGNVNCVSPMHLRLGIAHEGNGGIVGRRGERKLTEEQREAIVYSDGKVAGIAELYGITRQYVYKLRRWRDK